MERKRSQRRGVSLVEVLVSIAIIGLLVAIFMPAVQSARAASRKVSCQSNLHNIGVALANYVELKGSYPRTTVFFDREIAPFLELQQYYELDYLKNHLDELRLTPLLCPADDLADRFIVSYRINRGTQLFFWPAYGGGDYYGNGFATGPRRLEPLRTTEVSDGLSNTAGMSERALTPNEIKLVASPGPPPNRDRKRYYWYVPQTFSMSGEEPLAVDQCRNHRTTTEPVLVVSNTSGIHEYDHLLPPNHPACINAPAIQSMQSIDYLVPSSSMHAGGANTLLLDGSVRFVSENIGETVWQAVGTRNGNEVLGEW